MKLVASLIVAPIEIDRYLVPVVGSLLDFCDEVVLLFDGDGKWAEQLIGAWGDDGARVIGITPGPGEPPVSFFGHEGRARQRLVDATLKREPSHVATVDGDEFISDGHALRARIEAEPDVPVWSLDMLEVWNAKPDHLEVRCDGGWRPHPLSLVWKAPKVGRRYRMLDKKLACRRVPMEVLSQRAKPSGIDILHLGWTDKGTRQARYDRYAKHDGGKFHASSHLRSIMFPDSRVQLKPCPWPKSRVFDELRERFISTGGMPA